MSKLSYMPPGSAGTNETNSLPLKNTHGLSGFNSDSERAWMNTPGAIESRKVLKEVMSEEDLPQWQIDQLTERYELHEL